MKRQDIGNVIILVLALLALVSPPLSTQAHAYPSFIFSGSADVASAYQNPALNLDFAAYEVNYRVSLTPTAATTYTPAGSGTPYLLSNLAGSISLTGGLDSVTAQPAALAFNGKFNNLLFATFNPATLGLSFGIDDGTGTTSELLGVYDFGLPASYDLKSLFGPLLVPPFNFFTDAFGPVSADGFTGFTDMAGNLLDLEVLTYDATVSAVPEPGTFVLLAAALCGLWLWRRRETEP